MSPKWWLISATSQFFAHKTDFFIDISAINLVETVGSNVVGKSLTFDLSNSAEMLAGDNVQPNTSPQSNPSTSKRADLRVIPAVLAITEPSIKLNITNIGAFHAVLTVGESKCKHAVSAIAELLCVLRR